MLKQFVSNGYINRVQRLQMESYLQKLQNLRTLFWQKESSIPLLNIKTKDFLLPLIQNKPQRFNIRIAKNLIISQEAKILIISVTPQSLNDLLETIKSEVTKDHVLISIVSGISKTLTLSHSFLGAEIADIKRRVGNSEAAVIRAMPNTAIAFRESMTCIAAENRNAKGLDLTARIFDALGTTKTTTNSYLFRSNYDCRRTSNCPCNRSLCLWSCCKSNYNIIIYAVSSLHVPFELHLKEALKSVFIVKTLFA